MRYIIRLLQFLLASTFILSGLSKCIDPVGTAIKFNEYFLYFGLGFMTDWTLPLSWLVSILEFFCGFYLLFGHMRVLTLVLITLMMMVFTPLTLWLAVTDAIEDCGCFGDAIHLSNWETFGKNIIIDLVLFLLWLKRRFIYKVMGYTAFTVHTYIALAIIIGICSYGTFSEPLVDFRPYRPGVNLLKASQTGEVLQTSTYTCIYERNGVKQEFALDELPDEEEGWTFVETIEHVNSQMDSEVGEESVEIDFFVKNLQGEVVTHDLLSFEGYTFLLLSASLDAASQHDIDKLEQLFEYCSDNGYAFYCVTANDTVQYRNWLYNTGAEYPFLFTDATIVETICRSNPGVMLLHNGVICWKNTLSSLDTNQLTSAKLNEQSNGETEENDPYRIFFFLLILIFAPFPLFLLFEIPTNFHKSTKKDSKDA